MTFPAKSGDVFLLCSDGLTTMVSDEEIAEILGEAQACAPAVNKLIDAANTKGGRDNITAVAFRVAEEGEEPEEGATLISRTAEQAGLTGERMRRARRPPARAGADAAAAPPAARRSRSPLIVAAVAPSWSAASSWLSRQVYFLGTDEGGRVALYRGLPYDLPWGSISTRSSLDRRSRPRRSRPSASRSSPSTSCASEDDATDIDRRHRAARGLPQRRRRRPSSAGGQRSSAEAGAQQQQPPRSAATAA